MTVEHRLLGNQATKMHGIVWRTVANAAALAALAIVAADVSQRKVVLQTDTGELWVPLSTTPTFENIGTPPPFKGQFFINPLSTALPQTGSASNPFTTLAAAQARAATLLLAGAIFLFPPGVSVTDTYVSPNGGDWEIACVGNGRVSLTCDPNLTSVTQTVTRFTNVVLTGNISGQASSGAGNFLFLTNTLVIGNVSLTGTAAGFWFSLPSGPVTPFNSLSGGATGTTSVIGCLLGNNWNFGGAINVSSSFNLNNCGLPTSITMGAAGASFTNCTPLGATTITSPAAAPIIIDSYTNRNLRAAGLVLVGPPTFVSVNSDIVSNSSAVVGTTVSDALNTLSTGSVPTTRTITTTSPLRIDGGGSASLAANRTLTVLQVSNTTDGVAPAHAGAPDVGKALIATATASGWGTDFGTQTLTTTGDIKLGTSPASAGAVRLPNATFVRARNAANSSDVDVFTVTSGNVVSVGSTSFQTTLTAANTVTLSLTGGGTLNFNSLSGQQLLFNSTAATTFGMTSSAAAVGFLLTGRGHDSSAVGGTGGARLERAGDATGASGTRTGGAFDVRPGSGASAGGELSLQNGAGTKRVRINDTGLGLYANAPVAQAARVGQAVNSTGGTASGTRTFVDVTTTGLADPVKVNNNFATLVANMWNPIELALSALGATAAA